MIEFSYFNPPSAIAGSRVFLYSIVIHAIRQRGNPFLGLVEWFRPG
jgi:hypothetical protein